MIGECKLCRETKELLDSHVFPKFVIRWIKATGTGYIRFVESPNVRKQDGPVEKWLCPECEQLFSENEKYFAENIFRPVVEVENFSFNYDARLMRFLVSLLWRILHRDLPNAFQNHDEFVPELLAAEQEWRSFLLRNGELHHFDQVHLFIADLAGENPPGVPNWNLYCSRAVDGIVLTDISPRFVFAKFAKFMIVGVLSEYDERNWIGTRINHGTGALASPQSVHELSFGGVIYQRARFGFEKFRTELSERQEQVITSHISRNAEKLLNSELLKAVNADISNEARRTNRPD